MYRLKILEDKNPATLELKVDEFFRNNKVTRQDSRTHFQRTARVYLAFIEYEEASSLSVSLPHQPSSFPEGTNLRTVQGWAKNHVVKTYLQALYEKHDGNISHVAKEAGVSRYHMRSLLERSGIHKIEQKEE